MNEHLPCGAQINSTTRLHIIDQSIRGKEMVRLAVKYEFEILNIKKVSLGVYANNESAHNCYEAVGFVDQKFHEEFFPF